MYMDYSNFGINDLVFNTNKNGDLMGGGFVIQSELLKDTIQAGQESQSGGGVVDGASNGIIKYFQGFSSTSRAIFHTKTDTEKQYYQL